MQSNYFKRFVMARNLCLVSLALGLLGAAAYLTIVPEQIWLEVSGRLITGGIVGLCIVYLLRAVVPVIKRKAAILHLNQLQELVNKGALTQSEYDTKAKEIKQRLI